MKNNVKAKEDSTVIVLPESDEHTLCIEFAGLVSRDDHKKNLGGNLARIIEKNGWYNLLINYGPSFRGWEEGAADISLRSILDFAGHCRRRAIINPPEKHILLQKIPGSPFGGETRNFSEDQFQEALDWVKGSKKTD